MLFKRFLITILCLISIPAFTSWFIDIEGGTAISGYNDIRIPGNSGTDLSLTDELSSDTAAFIRLRFGFVLNKRHTFSLLYAPLTLKASGQVNKVVNYFGESFSANTPLRANYRFDSYRLTYRYRLLDNKDWTIGIGFTAKIRDAAIKIEGDGKTAEKKNTGFVPILNFKVVYHFNALLTLNLEGDALAAPQGRAEDIALSLQYKLDKQFLIKGGYRILEGGADNDEVYTFTLVHYFFAGVTFYF